MPTGGISLVPATLREAALDSPTFRGTILHYAEQVDLVEKWLDACIKASLKLHGDVLALEDPVNNFLLRTIPANISESLIDHDYTLLAVQRYAEGSRGFWSNIIAAARGMEKVVLEPMQAFQRAELRAFKEGRRSLETAQTKYDSLLTRYLSQSKSKEPSALREDAFQLYEARKAYFKTCYDFCVAAPLFRTSLDKLITKIISNQWREQTQLRKKTTGITERCGSDIERIRSCCDLMEVNETVFRKQLITARIELEKRTKTEYQPARELDEYSISTVPYLTSRPGAAVALEGEAVASEKQGWLFMRTLAGKPTRSVWIRRWFFVQSGTFGWLVQGYRGGGVEESEKVGVLLCNVKPAFQEERRFCFEVKTKDTTILLQTETQADLTSWLAVFEQAKRTAVEGTSLITSSQAFSILPPSVPAPPSEPAYVTKGHGSNSASSVIPVSNDRVPNVQHLHHLHHQDGLGFERATTMGPGTFGRGPSMDVMREGEATIPEPQESAIQKTGRKPSFTSGDRAPLLPGLGGPSGISALIAASHNALPFQADSTKFAFAEHYKSAEQHKPLSLTPNTLSSTPSPANLLTSATVTSGNGVTGTTEGSRLPEKGHRKAISLDIDSSYGKEEPASEAEYFPGYPVELKYQDAHFRMLFPGTKDHVVLLVFRGVWSPNDTQELPGRCFVTDQNLYFYSHYMGLVFTSVTPYSSVSEVKAAPEKDCDYIFLHPRPVNVGQEPITIKTFLEPLRLLQRRLQLLVANAHTSNPMQSRQLLQKLVAMEKDVEEKGADTESWDDLGLHFDGTDEPRRRKAAEGFNLRLDDDVKGDEKKGSGIKLPPGPVNYIPTGFTNKRTFEREFNISPKALFHIMFGEKSNVFQTVYAQRRSQTIYQSTWRDLEKGKAKRQFAYQATYVDILGRGRKADIVDHQTIEKQEDHLCYVVADVKTPWYLPHRQDFLMVSKFVITHVAKSKSKLSIWTRVDWFKDPKFSKTLVQTQALEDLDNDALDLGDIVAEAVRSLEENTGTANAVAVFGGIGSSPQLQQQPQLQPQQQPARIIPDPRQTSTLDPRAPRLPIRQVSLSQMLIENGLSMAESAISSVIMWTIAALKWASDIVTAHRLLILFLAISVVANLSLSVRSTRAYWSERRASNFLETIELTPDGVMARSITLRDLQEAIEPAPVFNLTGGGAAGLCRSKFRELAQRENDGGGGLGPRIREGRERLGVHRHDLIVALRVVNGLEKELMRAEWMRWVQGETSRCRAARSVGLVDGEVGRALEVYCYDCEAEEEGELGLEMGLGV